MNGTELYRLHQHFHLRVKKVGCIVLNWSFSCLNHLVLTNRKHSTQRKATNPTSFCHNRPLHFLGNFFFFCLEYIWTWVKNGTYGSPKMHAKKWGFFYLKYFTWILAAERITHCGEKLKQHSKQQQFEGEKKSTIRVKTDLLEFWLLKGLLIVGKN